MRMSSLFNLSGHSWVWTTLGGGVSLLAYTLILSNFFLPLLRPLSLLARFGYTLTAPILFVLFYGVFRLRGGWGRFLSFFFVLTVFALALAGAWASGVTESGILSGVVPMFDSASYYTDALRLLAGDAFSLTSSRRPMFIAFFAVLLFLSRHNLLMALSLLNLLVGMSCYLLAREIRHTHGAGMAAFVLLIVFLYYRFHSGAVRTESLGVAFSALGMAFLWRSIARQKATLALIGLLFTTLALIARAGAFLCLPLLLLWGGWVFRQPGKRFSWLFTFGGGGVVLAAFFVNQLITNTFGVPEAIPFGNFAYSFYGLAAGGKSWAEAVKAYPGASDLEIYGLAFNLIRKHPGLLVQGALSNWKMFFSNSNYGLYSFMRGETAISATFSYWALVTLCGLGVLAWLRHRADRFATLVLVASVGVLLSVPFLPPTDAFRVRAYAASIVVLGLLPALGGHFLLSRCRIFLSPAEAMPLLASPVLPAFSIVFLSLALVVPFLLRGVDAWGKLPEEICPPGTISLLVRYDPGTMIHLVSQKTQVLEWPPVYKVGNFQRNLHDFPNFAFAGWASEVKPGFSLFYALDRRTSQTALLVIPTALLPHPPAVLEVCGAWETGPELSQFFVFEAVSATALESP
ncbi:MAG: hypothetical protein Fur0043_02290 [Anaerolineales bacterium]